MTINMRVTYNEDLLLIFNLIGAPIILAIISPIEVMIKDK